MTQFPNDLRLPLEKLSSLDILLNTFSINSLCAKQFVFVFDVVALEGEALSANTNLLCNYVFLNLFDLEAFFVVA